MGKLTRDQAIRLCDSLHAELMTRYPQAVKLTDAYRGVQPLRFASPEFRKYFGNRYDQFSDNWVQVVADSPVERLTVMGVQPSGADSADSDMWRVWQENALDADSQLGFLGSVTTSRSFVLVWGDPDDEDTPTVTFEDNTQCVVAYEPGSRRKRVAALKRWQDGNREYATLYTADELWKFARSLSRIDKSPNLASVDEETRQWGLRTVPEDEPNPQPNPMGMVPMVELPNRPLLLGDPISDVAGVMDMQDAVNLIWAQLFTASDFASFAQRIVLGAEVPKTPILDENGVKIGERPIDLSKFAVDRVLWIESADAKIAEWTASDLANYTNVLEVAVGHIAAQTRTPQHYLVGKMANLSGDALIAAETGLVKRCQEKQLWFGQALREVFQLIALAQGNTGKARAIRSGTVLWADTESRDRAQLADSLVKLKSIGFPFQWLAVQYGLTPPEVADLIEMREREAMLDPVTSLLGGKPDAPPADPGLDPEADVIPAG
jgi:hypothetical protein